MLWKLQVAFCREVKVGSALKCLPFSMQTVPCQGKVHESGTHMTWTDIFTSSSPLSTLLRHVLFFIRRLEKTAVLCYECPSIRRASFQNSSTHREFKKTRLNISSLINNAYCVAGHPRREAKVYSQNFDQIIMTEDPFLYMRVLGPNSTDEFLSPFFSISEVTRSEQRRRPMLRDG